CSTSLETLMEFVSAAKELSDVVDMPLHVSAPRQSCFRVMNSAEFSKLKPIEFREILRSQTIISVDENAIPAEFNIDSLLQLQSYSSVFDIEGILTCLLTGRVGSSFKDLSASNPPKLRGGTINDILKCAKQDDGRKIVQVRSMPYSSAGWTVGPFSTDYVAWRATERLPFANDSGQHLPIADSHFQLVATKGAYVWWDVAPRGLGRHLTFKTGGQCIWIARPRARAENGNVLRPSDYDIMGDVGLFLSGGYHDSKPRNTYWQVEQIYLGPGMTMYALIALSGECVSN
ncbi:hypothetical protein HYPSUDRAFT_60098, partial [Hypholoma sublateritium FD-334 SS-4]